MELIPFSSMDNNSRSINPLYRVLPQIPSSRKTRVIEYPPYDMEAIYKAYHADSYFSQACNKKRDLMFKNGFDFKRESEEVYSYFKKRIDIMMRVMKIPFRSFVKDISSHIVQFDNAFLLKHRGEYPASLSRLIKRHNEDLPIIGYELLHPATISIVRDHNNNNEYSYIQAPIGVRPNLEIRRKDDPEYRRFDIDEVIHIKTNSDSVYKFAAPTLKPVLDDIRILRELEDNASILVQRFIFPFIHVGIENAGQEKLDEWEYRLNEAPIDGVFVSSDALHFENIIGKGNIINAIDYLRYWEDRIFTGLGVSAVLMGRGDTSNKATADSIIVQIQDSIKELQHVIADYFNMFVANEILFEGGYDPYNIEHSVELFFNEIDIASHIMLRNHLLLMFQGGAINQDEIRKEIGLDPMTPDQLSKTFNRLFGIPAQGTGTTTNSNMPANQHGTRTGPKRKGESVDSVAADAHMMLSCIHIVNGNREQAISRLIDALKETYGDDVDHSIAIKMVDAMLTKLQRS